MNECLILNSTDVLEFNVSKYFFIKGVAHVGISLLQGCAIDEVKLIVCTIYSDCHTSLNNQFNILCIHLSSFNIFGFVPQLP